MGSIIKVENLGLTAVILAIVIIWVIILLDEIKGG